MSESAVIKLRKFDDLNDELDFLFNNYLKHQHSVLMPVDNAWKPLTDVYETETEFVVVMDIAEIEIDDISAKLKGNTLFLRGIRREQNLDPKRKYYKMEIDFGPFERKIELPSPVNVNDIQTRYTKGFLELRLPKGKSANGKKIEIPIK
jgi:HSP20 family protein